MNTRETIAVTVADHARVPKPLSIQVSMGPLMFVLKKAMPAQPNIDAVLG